MKANTRTGQGRNSERGAALYIVAGSMVVLLGISALAIDLVNFYLARAQAQRAADAGALAGASIFVSQGCTSTGGCSAGGPQELPAQQQAVAIASQNPVAGQAPSTSTISVAFQYPSAEEPQIGVTVYRDTTHGNPLPTYFGKIFGITTVNVSATAWAEAYNPSGGSTPVGTACLRPFLVPNCDPDHPVPGSSPNANKSCGGTQGGTNGITINCSDGSPGCYPSYFFLPNANGQYVPVNPGVYASGNPNSGVVGEPWQLHDNAAPSQWYLLGIGTPCGLAPPSSGSALSTYISACVPCVISCSQPLNTANGQKVGPTDQGIDTLINASGDGPNMGQDTICSPTTAASTGGSFCAQPPFPITGGTGNPNPALRGQTFYGPSSSIASVAVYDGYALPPGGTTVIVRGFMQLFIVDAQGPPVDGVDTIVLGIGGCGAATSTNPPATANGGSFIPIRLIHQ